MGLNYEKGFLALKEVLSSDTLPRFEELYGAWQELEQARRLYGDTDQLRHDRSKLYRQFLQLAAEVHFDLHRIVIGS